MKLYVGFTAGYSAMIYIKSALQVLARRQAFLRKRSLRCAWRTPASGCGLLSSRSAAGRHVIQQNTVDVAAEHAYKSTCLENPVPDTTAVGREKKGKSMGAKHRLKRLSTACFALTVVTVLGFIGQCAEAQNQQVENPYSPAYGHPYRHGAVPTREAWQKMKQWWATHPASGESAPASGSGGIMTFQGGVNGIGVVSGVPKVYLVFWGSQWVNGGDPNGAATYLQHFYAGVGTGGEMWSGTMTQYCDGPNVARGASSCPSTAPHVGYPSSGSLSNVWFDDSAPVPTDATQAQIAAEAVAAAVHFGNTSAASNRYAQYVIAFPSGAAPDGFPNSTVLHNSCCQRHALPQQGH